MKRLKIIAAAFVFMATMVMGAVFGAQTVSAYTCPSGTPGAGKDVNSLAECSISESEDTFIPTLWQIIRVVLQVLGIVAVLVIILGGFYYMTAQGDPGKITKAKNTILYGVIGLVVALLAFAIVNFVLENVFSGSSSDSNSGITTSDECTKAGKTWDGTTNTCK